MINHRTKIAVAMSGGVDSSVAALLLKQKGFDVIGITMRIWKCAGKTSLENLSAKKLSCSIEDVEDAKKVAEQLNIPHYVVDFRDEFEKFVIEPFCKSYLNGITPNPCIVCNKKIKFDLLVKKILSMGIEYLATGHYARIEQKTENRKIRYELKKAIDKRTDQSYWLYGIPRENLQYILFPLGKYTKSQVRKIGIKHNLSVALKPKSQEICFISDGNYRRFLAEKINISLNEQGEIVDTNGVLLGKHCGIYNFTIGQRTGLNISIGKRLYVKEIIASENKIVVGEKQDLYNSECIVSDVNWISKLYKLPVKLKVKIRAQHKESTGIIYRINGKKNLYRIKFTKPQFAITPGQSAVFYDGEVVVGGGVIKKCLL